MALKASVLGLIGVCEACGIQQNLGCSVEWHAGYMSGRGVHPCLPLKSTLRSYGETTGL